MPSFIFCGIYTFLKCFESLFLCVTKFGGSTRHVKFDKFRYTAPWIKLLKRFVVVSYCDCGVLERTAKCVHSDRSAFETFE